MKTRVRELRRGRGMTVDALAGQSGVSRATIWKLEQSEVKNVSIGTLNKITKALGVKTEKLIKDENG